jgi:hypothetical protein
MYELCIYAGCNNIATFNYDDTDIRVYCMFHKLEDMIDTKCITEYCNTLTNKDKYNGYCEICFIHSFYDHII